MELRCIYFLARYLKQRLKPSLCTRALQKSRDYVQGGNTDAGYGLISTLRASASFIYNNGFPPPACPPIYTSLVSNSRKDCLRFLYHNVVSIVSFPELYLKNGKVYVINAPRHSFFPNCLRYLSDVFWYNQCEFHVPQQRAFGADNTAMHRLA